MPFFDQLAGPAGAKGPPHELRLGLVKKQPHPVKAQVLPDGGADPEQAGAQVGDARNGLSHLHHSFQKLAAALFSVVKFLF
jgi:hypothetical protein